MPSLSAATRRVARLVEPELAQRLEAATATFASAIHDGTPGRIDRLDDEMTTYLIALRDAASRARSAIDTSPSDPEGCVRARRGGDGAVRHQRHRDTHRGVLRPRDSEPRRCGVAGPRGQPRIRPGCHAGGTAFGGRSVARQALRAVHRGADVGDVDCRRIVRRHGRGMGIDGGDEKPDGGASTSAPRSITPNPESSTSQRICRRRGVTAPGPPSSSRDRGADRRRRRPHTGPLLVDAGRAGRRRSHARAAVHTGAVPGRRHHRRHW